MIPTTADVCLEVLLSPYSEQSLRKPTQMHGRHRDSLQSSQTMMALRYPIPLSNSLHAFANPAQYLQSPSGTHCSPSQASADVTGLWDQSSVTLQDRVLNTSKGIQNSSLSANYKELKESAVLNQDCLGFDVGDRANCVDEWQMKPLHHGQNAGHGARSHAQMPLMHSHSFPSTAAKRMEIPIRPNLRLKSPRSLLSQVVSSPASVSNNLQFQTFKGTQRGTSTSQQQIGSMSGAQTSVTQHISLDTRPSIICRNPQIEIKPRLVARHGLRPSDRIDQVSLYTRPIAQSLVRPALLRNSMRSSALTAKHFSSFGPHFQGIDYRSREFRKGRPIKAPHKDDLIILPAPKPTAAYMRNVSVPPDRLTSPQTLLVILDLNGTLLYWKPRTSKIFPRPGLQEFLSYCFEYHSILVWSSAQSHNIKEMCRRIFIPELRPLLLGEWGRNTLGLTPEQYRQRVLVFKNLDTVWSDETLQSLHPDAAKGGTWGQHNTVLIDDTVSKAAAQPFNHIKVPEFKVTTDNHDNMEENVLVTVETQLEEARSWSDLSAFFKQKSDEPASNDRLE